MKITKNQLQQIIKEELAVAVNESPDVFGADYNPAEKVKNIIAPEQAESHGEMEALQAIEWAKTAHPDDGSPRWADPLYTQAYDNRRQHALDNISDRDDTTRPIRAVPVVNIDSTLEVDGRALGAQVAKHTMAEQSADVSALEEALKRWKKLIK